MCSVMTESFLSVCADAIFVQMVQSASFAISISSASVKLNDLVHSKECIAMKYALADFSHLFRRIKTVR